MRWLLGLVIFTASAFGQPDLLDQLRHAVTPQDVVRIVSQWERGGNLALHTATWDGAETLTGSMVSTFDRDTATFDLDHQTSEADAVASAADTRRYGGDVAVFGARTLETLVSTADSIHVYASGLDSGGLPVVVYDRRSTPPVFIVARGGGTFATITSKTLTGGANKPSATDWDLLSGETDEEADYAHAPRGAVCLPGIILVQCCSLVYDGAGSRTDAANWNPDGVSLCYSTDNGATWELAWRSASLINVTPPDDFGSEWSITASHLARDGTNTEFWITVASYASGSNRTADTFVCKVSGGSGAWTVGNAHVFNHPQGTDATTHVHYSATFTNPADADGLKLICELGDGDADNLTTEYLCTSAANFLTGASAVAGSVNVVSGGTNWSGPVVINGKDGAAQADQQMSNQTISYAPGPNGGWYAGADEGGDSPIQYATVPATNGARVNWRHAYGFGSAFNGFNGANPYEINWRVFTLNAWDYSASNPAVVALIAPGNQWIAGYTDIARVVYKPEGETTFGVVYAPQGESDSTEQLRPVLSPDGYIYLGSIVGTGGNGLRRFAAPSASQTRIQKAIYAGPGGVNLALATPTTGTVAINAASTCTIGAAAPQTPPTTGAAMHFVAGEASAHQTLGSYKITGDVVTKTHTTLTVQVLVYTDTDAAIIDSSTFFRARFITTEGGSTTPVTLYRGPSRMETRGHFSLLTYVLNQGVGATDDWDLSGLTAPLILEMQLQTNTGVAHPQEFWMWIVGVYEDIPCPPSYLVPPATTGDTETLELSGFACGTAWTAGVVGVLGGEYGRDCRSNTANTFREFCTLWEDADTYIEFAWDADDQVRIRCTDGATVTNTTLTGLPKFLRGDPFIAAVSYNAGTGVYTYSLSAAGTVVANGTIAASAVVKPTKVLLSQDDDGTMREATRWLYASIDTGASKSQDQLDNFVGDGGDGPPPAIWRNRDWRTRGR